MDNEANPTDTQLLKLINILKYDLKERQGLPAERALSSVLAIQNTALGAMKPKEMGLSGHAINTETDQEIC